MYISGDSGGGRAVTTHTRWPGFKSSHRYNIKQKLTEKKRRKSRKWYVLEKSTLEISEIIHVFLYANYACKKAFTNHFRFAL